MIDLSQYITRYFPQSPVVVAFTATSTAFQAVNTSAFEQVFVFDCDQDCYVKAGPNDIAAASSSDWPLRAGQHTFVLKPGFGARVIRKTADGTLTIGSAGV